MDEEDKKELKAVKVLGIGIAAIILGIMLFVWFVKNQNEVEVPEAIKVEDPMNLPVSTFEFKQECEWNIEKYPKGCKG